MRGDERAILRIISALEVADAEAIARKVVLSPGYVEELCDSLVGSGYLTQIAGGKYRVTPRGERYNPGKYIVTPHRASMFRD